MSCETSKTPLILDTSVSGVVESVIEVTHNDTTTESEGTIGEKTEEGQTFAFEDSKFGLIEVREEGEPQENSVKPFECELCKKQFTKIEILKRHIKTHLKDKVNHSERSSMILFVGTQEFKCTYCTKTFDRRDVLNDHVRNHTGEKPFQCTVCSKKFTRGFVLLRHMRTHGEGAFKCDFCLKTFDRCWVSLVTGPVERLLFYLIGRTRTGTT